MPSASETDFENMDLGRHLHEVAECGAAYIPGYLRQGMLVDLQKLFREVEFTEIFNTYEKVVERYHVPKDIPLQVERRINTLAEGLRNRLSAYASRYPVLADWHPNDHSVQLYDESSYITSHRDHATYRGVIAVLSIQGEANFEVREARHGKPFAVWRAQPGDMVILRSSGFSPSIERYPGIFHAVSGALTPIPRVSIGFRQK